MRLLEESSSEEPDSETSSALVLERRFELDFDGLERVRLGVLVATSPSDDSDSEARSTGTASGVLAFSLFLDFEDPRVTIFGLFVTLLPKGWTEAGFAPLNATLLDRRPTGCSF